MNDPADLSHLADIVAPSPVPWWPPAPGWWILTAGILATLAVLGAIALGRYRRNAYRRAALAELATINAADPASVAAISGVLKRTALVAYPRSEVASLTGSAWLAFLDRAAATTDFTAGQADGLDRAAMGSTVANSGLILAAARQWVLRHRATV